MNFNKRLVVLSFLLIIFLFMGSVMAVDGNMDNNLTTDSSNINLEVNQDDDILNEDLKNNDDVLGSVSENNFTLSSSKTWVVDEVEENHNEMTDSTIQLAINKAGAGDTIIVNGKSYVHCHFVIDKKLTILSNVGTTMKVCPSNTQGSGHHGIFYISPSASGTVIEGFSINNDVSNADDYGVFVNGASDVIIRNCTIVHRGSSDAIRFENAKNSLVENVTLFNANNGIRIVDCQGFNVKNSSIKNSKIGVKIINSISTSVAYNDISGNTVSGIAFSGNGKHLTVNYNNITSNLNGINLTCSNYAYILSNYIAFNTNNGVYVDYNITKIEIKGNFFNQNHLWEVFNDFHVLNINDVSLKNVESLEVITNNYMINYGGGGTADIDRPVWTQIYEYNPNIGNYNYDESKDVYVYVGDGNGQYYGHQGIMYLGYVFEINEFVSCPNIYYSPAKIWSKSGNYELLLSNIKQIKKGIYSISIVDAKGNIATDLSSVPVTFYLNKVGNSVSPQEGEIYKTVMLVNGTATVRFYMDEFTQSGNVITAVFPTPGTTLDAKVSKTFNVKDSEIPGIPLNTSIKVYNLNTYPNSNQQIIATLVDQYGAAVAGEVLTFTINSKTCNVATDSNGQAKIKISESKVGNYTLKVKYEGDDVEYNGNTSSASVVVKKTATEMISYNLNMIPEKAEYFSITLKNAFGGVLTNQKVTFKVNGKTYTKTTNNKGVAKVKLRFNKNNKNYKIKITYKGSNKYASISKTNKIKVKYSSKTAKLITPKITIPPKIAKYYKIALKDGNSKGIAKQKVIIKINGKKFTKRTNSKGEIKIKVKFSKLKTYKVKAVYKGSKIYKKAVSNGKVKVDKTATSITAPSISMVPNEFKTYSVTLKANNKAFAKQRLTIKVNGNTYVKTTDSKGQASVGLNFDGENTYAVNVVYKGNKIYKASKATGKVTVSKVASRITSYDKTYSKNSQKDYRITLKDKSGNAIPSQSVMFKINNRSYNKTTDSKGVANIGLDSLEEGSFDIVTTFGGTYKYKSISKTNKIKVSGKLNTVFVDNNLPNSEIQSILDGASNGSDVEFLGDNYSSIALTINNALNVYSSQNTTLTAKTNTPVFAISGNNINISGFIIRGNSDSAISVNNGDNVHIYGNNISNMLDESKMRSYLNATVNMPGCGVEISNSRNVAISNNTINLFESGIFAEYSSNLLVNNNTLKENNYGIKYGYGVANTEILYNEITDQIGLYIMTVPEGPSGYGIFFNNSAVNVTVNHNHIYSNHLGISLDANHTTGIVITQNTITDNVLEGIRFNAGYDLALNAVEPHVTDNAIYRNARGPSMMILGELSANPEGIYGNGLYNDGDKLQLEANWYGTNNLVTWDYDAGVIGYGTMCPRINTTNIIFNMTRNSHDSYSIVFYKNGELASNLPEFDMYATLNKENESAVEVIFNVVNGVGTFALDSQNYIAGNNTIDISIGSLFYSTSRVFKVTYSYEFINDG
ncbi:Ig-like domain repeat protein [Methanobrevibacter sp. V74]|uniref:right-handed parallel beta-helix repeat-containing protein n=1 Tax=Methanobrevibacter sp. V74 TaxID=3064279 RepID=UPI002735D0E8|nr:Ig-like domain repeat protein [Methanobrevibacter sp. V74]